MLWFNRLESVFVAVTAFGNKLWLFVDHCLWVRLGNHQLFRQTQVAVSSAIINIHQYTSIGPKYFIYINIYKYVSHGNEEPERILIYTSPLSFTVLRQPSLGWNCRIKFSLGHTKIYLVPDFLPGWQNRLGFKFCPLCLECFYTIHHPKYYILCSTLASTPYFCPSTPKYT